MHNIPDQEQISENPLNGELLKESEYTYDQKFKQLFQNRKFLVPILKNVVKEYKNLTLFEIEDLIVSITGEEEVAASIASEDVGREDEIKNCYDVLIGCRLPESESSVMVDLYFDLEMQREQNPGYPLLKRGIYYCSRMISRQLTNTQTADYGALKPVYSVWIIINDIPKALQYSRYEVSLKGSGSLTNAAYAQKRKKSYHNALSRLDSQIDMIHLCLIFLAEDFMDLDETDDALIRYIQSIFIRKSADAHYNPYADYSKSIQKEADHIMTIMDMFEARGEKRGIEKGIEKGIERGIEKGIEKGIERGVELGTARGIINTGRRHAFSDQIIIEDIAAQTGCSFQDAKKILYDYDNM